MVLKFRVIYLSRLCVRKIKLLFQDIVNVFLDPHKIDLFTLDSKIVFLVQ